MKKYLTLILLIVILMAGAWIWYNGFRLEQYSDPNNGFVFGYPKDFTLSNTDYRNQDRMLRGIKVSRNLSAPNCSESGLIEHCQPLTENPAISFFVIGSSLEEATRSDEDSIGSLMKNINIAGRDGRYVEIGAEGEGLFIYYLPLSESKTLLITRNYIDENTLISYKDVEDFLSLEQQKEVFDEIIGTLKITD